MRYFFLLALLFLADLSIARNLIGMGNPFSFEVDGVRFDNTTNADEKSEWAIRVQNGENAQDVAREILERH